MILAQKHLALIISAFALFAVCTTPHTFAINEDLFLDASIIVEEENSTTTNPELFSSSSDSRTAAEANEAETAVDDHHTMGMNDVWGKVKVFLTTFGFFSVNKTSGADAGSETGFTANVRISEVEDRSATIAWSPSVFSNVKVYYASTSPVLVSDSVLHVSPWKPWNRSQVTLKGLSPNTIYFYKVVAQTSSGTIVSAEASFKTITE